MRANELPSPELLRQLLRYDEATGKLYWRERSLDLFDDGKWSAEQRCNNWNSRFSGREAGTLNTTGYINVCLFGKHYAAHRVVWTMLKNNPPLGQIDHINGNRCDNRIENLRVVSNAENMRNAKRYSTNKSGVTGVYWVTKSKKWRAFIMVDWKEKHLGLFTCKNDAIAARCEAEIKYGFHKNHGRW